MRRQLMTPRPNYQHKLEEIGLSFHAWDNYWCEDVAYVFNESQIDEIEAATQTLHSMCLAAVAYVIEHDLLDRFMIPSAFHPLIKQSFQDKEPSLYGRFDLAFDGKNPPKMLEYNADTPTSLLESAVAQWYWMQEQQPDADQFNSLHEKLVDRWPSMNIEGKVHFASLAGNEEDWVCTHYLMDTALQAGLSVEHIDLEDIGVAQTESGACVFVDVDNQPILNLFKLYPWEWLMREEFADTIVKQPLFPNDPDLATRWIEPVWKSILSCKAILPVLWQLYPEHPNLLPAYFQDDERAKQLTSFAKKPLYSREGANVSLVENQRIVCEDTGPYGEEGFVYQALAAMPVYDGYYPVLGSWVVADQAAGLCIREDVSPITTNMSRFVPHFFVKE